MKPDAMQKPATSHWTYEDYLRLPDDGTRCEIIEGERLMTPAPWSRHQWTSAHLTSALLTYVESHGLGSVYAAPFDVVLADDTVVQPDIVVILKEHDGRLKEPGLFGAPDLAVEILSASTEERDRTLKMRVYAKKGVRELWIVDPVASLVEIYVLEKNRLVKVREHESGEARSVAVLPGFSVPLAAIIKP